jgi:hypothetical protein
LKNDFRQANRGLNTSSRAWNSILSLHSGQP